jgi:hypothetical protein
MTLIFLVVFGLLLWLANTRVPMGHKGKKVMNVFAMLLFVLWLLHLPRS